jgi:hypothetical protein
MGKLMVAINGKSLFEWEGDVAEAAKIEEQVREISKLGNTTPDILAQRRRLCGCQTGWASFGTDP